MSSSAWLGGVGGEVAAGAAEVVVEGDGGGEREQALADASAQAVQCPCAVAFEGEEVFEGPEDALDTLSDRCQVQSSAGFVFAARADDVGVAIMHRGGEVAACVALVADDDDAPGALDAFDERQADIALVKLWARQRDRARGAVQREQAVQPKPQKYRLWLRQ